MAIKNGSTVSIEYTLSLDDGTQVDGNVGADPLVYTQGGGEILPSLELALEGLEPEDMKKVKLSPDQGYGPMDENAFHSVSPDRIPEEARQEGALLMASGDQGQQRPIRVHEIHDDRIILDFNHPLAGQNLNFDVRIIAVD